MNAIFLAKFGIFLHFNSYLIFWQAQELNKQFAQKIRERDNIIIRVREANKQLKADSNNQNGFLSKTKPGVKKRLVSEQSTQSVEEMESEIDDLKSQLEGRDDEVKVSKIDLEASHWEMKYNERY